MKKHSSLALMLILILVTPLFAQTPTPQDEQIKDEDVVRITTNLIQVDAVVVDKDGRQVKDLRPDEFEVYEDGHLQQITNFSYISLEAENVAQSPAPPARSKTPAPPAQVRAADARRVVVMVVDDLALSMESTIYVRRAIRKFVDEQMQPGDLVAIAHTAGDAGALQQLTADKRQLSAAIDRVRWKCPNRVGSSAFQASGCASDNPAFWVNVSLDALNFIVRGLKELPGRKAVIFFSDDFVLTSRPEDFLQTDGSQDADGKQSSESVTLSEETARLSTYPGAPAKAVNQLIDLANQASVVIYAVDPRGLPTLNQGAADSKAVDLSSFRKLNPTSNRGAQITEANQTFDNNMTKLQRTQEGLRLLAEPTGGFLVRNTNDISGGVERIMRERSGYYLIGYHPADETFKKDGTYARFHQIKLKVKRPGLTVRSRQGFYGISEEERRQAQPKSADEQLLTSLASPFRSDQIGLRLTALFNQDPRAGSVMRSSLHIDARSFSFKEEADGWHAAKMQVLAMTFDAAGEMANKVKREETIRVRGESYQKLLRYGLVYTFDVPVKKPGAYQLRVSVRDPVTERVGSSSQFVEVPDLKKGQLALSGITARGVSTAKAGANAVATREAAAGLLSAAPQIAAPENGTDENDAQPDAAVRRLRRGMSLDYSYTIFNAKLARGSSLPQLQTQYRLFQNGQEILTGQAEPFDAAGQTNLKQLTARGQLPITENLAPGEYTLQIIVTDKLGKEKHNTATQWVEFEIQ